MLKLEDVSPKIDFRVDGPVVLCFAKRLKEDIFWNRMDMNIFLSKRNMYLQRDLVWTPEQKSELIISIIKSRGNTSFKIPPVATAITLDDEHLVVDGKQRLTTIRDFLLGKVPVFHKGSTYNLKDFNPEFIKQIEHYIIEGYRGWNDKDFAELTEEQLVNWFNMINFAGTPQDAAHREKLMK